jgi:Flp pilus assembly pilin Flp
MFNSMNRGIANRQGGQGMSEYIIVVALVALAAITVVGMFGGIVQEQFSNMAATLSGDDTAVAAESERDDDAEDMADFFEDSTN